MPLPTEAEIQAAISAWVMQFQQLKSACATYETREATYLLAVPTDVQPRGATAAAATRAALNAILANAGSALPDLFTTYFRVAGFSFANFDDGWNQLVAYMVANSKAIKTRAITFDTPAASGSPVGTGLVRRLTKDRYNGDIESAFIEAKTITCDVDQWTQGGQLGSEVFTLRGAAAKKDGIVLAGSGVVRQFVAVGGVAPTSTYLDNASFDLLTGTAAAPTAINGWTANVTVDSSNFVFEESTYYRTSQGVLTPRALRLKANCKLTQRLKVGWNPNQPAYLELAFNRQDGSADGTLTIRLGGKSKAVTLSAQTGYNVLRIDATSDAYFKNWNDGASLDVEIEWSSRTTGTLLIDSMVLCPWQEVGDGTFLVVVPGATAFKKEDAYGWTDTATDAAIIQYWIARALGRYLPSASGGSITWADPT